MTFPSGWSRQVLVTPVAAQISGGPYANFAVVLTRANLPDEMCDPSGTNAAQANGGDIRATSDAAGTQPLPLEVVAFALDSATGAKDAVAVLWVGTPSFSASAGVYLWYHAATAQAQPAATDPAGRNAVWANFIAAYHMLNTTAVTDSSGNGGDYTITNRYAGIAGPFGPTSTKINYNTTAVTPTLALDQNYTALFAMSLPTYAATGNQIWWDINGAGGVAYELHANAGGTSANLMCYDNSGTGTQLLGTFSLSPFNSWSWLGLSSTDGSGTQSAYVNGAPSASSTLTRRTGTGTLSLQAGGAAIYYAEVLIGKGLWSDSQHATFYNNVSSPSSFFATGTPQTPASGGVSVNLSAGALTFSGVSQQAAAGQAGSVGAGTLAFSGRVLQPTAGQSATLQAGMLSFAGQPVQPAAGQANRLQAGVLSLAGQTVQPIAGQAASVSPGALTILGQALAVQIGTNVPAVIDIASGSLSLTPQELLAQAGFAVVAGASSVSLAGKPLAVSAGMVGVLGPATLNIAGQALQFATGANVSIDIGAGKLDLSGVPFGAVAGFEEAVAAGVITLIGNAITVTSGGAAIIDSARLVVIQGFNRIVRIN